MSNRFNVYDGFGSKIFVIEFYDEPDKERERINSLISAAPDLLEALITCQQHLFLTLKDVKNEKIRLGRQMSIDLATIAINKALL